MRQFSEHGFKGATVRGIAHEAGVSVGLLQHYFASKQRLRDECDAHVFEVLRNALDRVNESGASSVLFVAETHDALTSMVPYLAMVMTSGAPVASEWFDAFTHWYRGLLSSGDLGPALPESEDTQAIVAVYTAMQLGLAIFAKHLYRQLGADERDVSATVRIGRARLFLDRERLIDEALETDIRIGLQRYADGPMKQE